MKFARALQHSVVRCGALGLLVLSVLGCGSADAESDASNVTPPDTTPDLPPFDPNVPPPSTCKTAVVVDAESQAFVVTDPAILSAFSLERVLKQLVSIAAQPGVTAESLLQRMFDTENDIAHAVFPDNLHCDDPTNAAFINGPATDCPRVEGALASSAGLFVPGDKDYFAPIALVNRFDLMNQGLMTCGEYRIVFAKWSGRTDPNDRLFLIFEGALTNPNPGDLMGCTKVARAWADVGKAKTPTEAQAILEQFYFEGLPGVLPLVHPNHFGVLSPDDDPYGSSRGQVRVSQRMQDPWELREYRIVNAIPDENTPPFYFKPSTVKNNPRPEFFETSVQTDSALSFRSNFLGMALWSLGQAEDLAHLRMQTSNTHNAGESAISGAAAVDYLGHASAGPGVTFTAQIQEQLNTMSLGTTCPPSDPLTAEALVHRAAALTCAGCHAPEKFIGPERKLGCGMTFPKALGEVHIDEHGTLSPALHDVFLPRRAEIMSTYLSDCDKNAMFQNLEPAGGAAIPK